MPDSFGDSNVVIHCKERGKAVMNKGTCKELFGVFFKIGAFTFGGGYAMIPLIKREVVEEKK